MDIDRFASLVQTLVSTPSRRAVMRGLTALVAGSALTPLLGAKTEAAKRRGHQRGHRRDERGAQVQDERKKGKKKKKLCANAGQTPSKKRKRCCRGLVRDGSGSCAQPASSSSNPCAACANPTPICAGNSCVACTSSTQCPARTICDGGSCQACTVCASGCLYPNVESALLDPAGPAVVRLCAGAYKPLTINREVTLIGAGNGNGPGNTVFNGGNKSRVLNITTFLPVTLRNLRITGGATTDLDSDEGRGGGIWNGAQLTLSDCVITGNTGPWGGGMHNVGEAHLTRCIVSDNEGMSVEVAGVGGGISNMGPLTLVNSRVTDNRAGDGAGIFSSGGEVTLNQSDVDTNKALGVGGGIYATSSQVHLLNGSRITGNQADPEALGAGVFLDDTSLDISGGSSITGNTPDDCFDGDSDECPP